VLCNHFSNVQCILLHVEKGILHKDSFWIPKYVADAYDGKSLWLLIGEEELRGKYQYGKKPPQMNQFTKDFESFKGTPYGQNRDYAADFYKNIRFVENYKNIRDLHIAHVELTSHKSIESPVQPIAIESKIGGIKNSDTASSSPIRLQSIQLTSGTIKKAVQQDRSTYKPR
jgi:hypothetical protein